MSPTDPEAYAWPDYTDLVGRIRELEATVSRVRTLGHNLLNSTTLLESVSRDLADCTRIDGEAVLRALGELSDERE